MSFTELKHNQDSVELTDSDYPPVYGEPVLERPQTEPPSKESILAAIAGEISNSPSLINDDDVYAILNKEGYEVEREAVAFLNTFPSPMDAFQYALYSFGLADFFIVIMVNIRQKSVYGYHILDLTQNYSLADDLINRLKNKDFVV